MRQIHARKIRPEDIVVGAQIFRYDYKDFVKQYEVKSIKEKDSIESVFSAHIESRFHEQTGVSVMKRHADGTNPFLALNEVPREHPITKALLTKPEDRRAYLEEVHGPIQHVVTGDYYIECDSTDPLAVPFRVIEPEGVMVTMQVFVPNAVLANAAAYDNEDLGGADDALVNDLGCEIVKDLIKSGQHEACFDAGGVEVDYASARPVSECHVHVFDRDGVLVHSDVRSSVLGIMGGAFQIFVPALEVDVFNAQREVIRGKEVQAAETQASREATARLTRGGRR